MFKIYGRKGKSTPLPDTYEQEVELILTRQTTEATPIAWGKWTSNGFYLKAGSLVMEKDTFESNKPGIKAIKKELIDSHLLDELYWGSYTLQHNICFHSPSAAGELVNGHSCNGLKDWKNSEGISLGDLLYK